MSQLLNKLISSYYEAHKADGDSQRDALSAMKELERRVVAEVIEDNTEVVKRLEHEAQQQEMERARKERLRESVKGYGALLFECVILALLVGLIGSVLYGILEALIFAPNSGFNYFWAIVVLVILLALCVAMLGYEFVNRISEWASQAMRRDNDE